MSQPTQSQVHVDAILTQISVAYMQARANFIADKVFPIVAVQKQSDKYFTYTKNDWFRDEAKQRADGTPSAGSGYGLSTASYACDVFAMHKDIGVQALANQDQVVQLERGAVEFVTQRLLVRREAQWVTDYFATSVWDTDVVGGANFTRWSDYAGSNPTEDIELGKETILKNTGFEPNTLVLGYQTFRQLKHHPDLKDQFKYTSPDSITPAMMAAYFDIERVLVAKAVKATNIENETGALDFAVGKHALLCHVAQNPGLLVPSAGYIFSWRGVSDNLGFDIGVSSFYIPERKCWRYEGEVAWDNKKVASDLGYFFSGAVI